MDGQTKKIKLNPIDREMEKKKLKEQREIMLQKIYKQKLEVPKSTLEEQKEKKRRYKIRSRERKRQNKLSDSSTFESDVDVDSRSESDVESIPVESAPEPNVDYNKLELLNLFYKKLNEKYGEYIRSKSIVVSDNVEYNRSNVSQSKFPDPTPFAFRKRKLRA